VRNGSPPARVAEDVDIWRPEGQAFEDVATSLANGFVVLGSGFGTDDSRHIMEKCCIPGSAERDGLWEDSRKAGPGDAVQTFAPVVIGRHLEARNCTSLINKLGCFFLQRHASDKIVHPPIDGQARVEIRCRGSRRARLGKQIQRCNGIARY